MLHSVTRFPDVNSHSCRMSRTNAPWDTMPHDSWLGCDPARCGNGAARGLELKRNVGAQHGVRKRCGLCATFRPSTVSVATRILTLGARRNGRLARDAGRSCRWLPTLEPTLVAWTAVLALSLRSRLGRTPQLSRGHCRLGTYGCNGSCAVKGCLIDKYAFQKKLFGQELCAAGEAATGSHELAKR